MKLAHEIPLSTAAACIVALSLIQAANAYTDKQMEQIFRTFDTNGDGKVTREEFDNNKVAIIYSRIPTDPIAGVTFEETVVSRQFFDSADANHDGKLSPHEILDALPFEAVTESKGDYFEIGDLARFLNSIGRQ